MKCKFCGCDNPEGATSCKGCGVQLKAPVKAEPKPVEKKADTPVSEAVPPVKEKKPLSKEVIRLIIVASISLVVVAALIITLVILLGNKTGYDIKGVSVTTQVINPNANIEDRMTAIFYSDKYKSEVVDGMLTNIWRSADGESAFMKVNDVNEDSITVNFYHVDNDGVVKIDSVKNDSLSEITRSFNDITISYDGSTVLYTGPDSDIRKWRKGDSEPTVVAEYEKDLISTVVFVLSPDGASYAYGTFSLSDELEVKLVINGKEQDAVEDTIPIAIANGGKYIYSLKLKDNAEPDLYLYDTKGNGRKIASEATDKNFYFNKDLSEIMFRASGNTYVSVKGGDKIKMFDGEAYPLLNQNIQYMSREYAEVPVAVIGIDTYKNKPFSCEDDDSLLMSDGDYVLTELVDDVWNAVISENGKHIFFVTDRDSDYGIYRYTISSKKVVLVAEEVEDDDALNDLSVSPDGNSIYYFTDSDADEVYLWRNGKKGVKVAEGVEGALVTNDILLYVDDEDILYGVKGTGKPVRLLEDMSDYSPLNGGGRAFYISESTDDGFKVYVLKGMEFELIYEYTYPVED